MPPFATYNLSKRYPGARQYALRGVDLDIPKAKCTVFWPPRPPPPLRAGKTTTIRLLMDFIRPTAGEAYILGCETVSRVDGDQNHRRLFCPARLRCMAK